MNINDLLDDMNRHHRPREERAKPLRDGVTAHTQPTIDLDGSHVLMFEDDGLVHVCFLDDEGRVLTTLSVAPQKLLTLMLAMSNLLCEMGVEGIKRA